jgi:hypothetical protein
MAAGALLANATASVSTNVAGCKPRRFSWRNPTSFRSDSLPMTDRLGSKIRLPRRAQLAEADRRVLMWTAKENYPRSAHLTTRARNDYSRAKRISGRHAVPAPG